MFSTSTNNNNKYPTIVSAEFAAKYISTNELVPVDGSWYLPFQQRDPYSEYIKERIVGARYFDIDECSDKTTQLPHMLPTMSEFNYYMGYKLGIREVDNLLIYDTHGMFSCARVWLTLNIFGHVGKIFVLDGGLNAWKANNYPVARGDVTSIRYKHYNSQLNDSMIKTFDDIIHNNKNKQFTILDARASGRYDGTQPEIRADLQSGHMPNSINVPFTELITSNNGINQMKSVEQLQQVFKSRNIDINGIASGKQKITTSCGSGVTASIITLALDRLGIKPQQLSLYDGSWTEYATEAKRNSEAVIEKS